MIQVLQGDCLDMLPTLAPESVQCVVTSPPYYGLRNYGIEPSQWPDINYKPMSGLGKYVAFAPNWPGCLGDEPMPELFVAHLVHVFRLLRPALKNDGTVWLNLGDSYGTGTSAARKQGKHGLGANTQQAQDIPRVGGMAKQLFGIPWRVALALQADGWYLRSDIIWEKPNAMPESVTDRPTKSHEHMFLLAKSERYFYDADAIYEPNKTTKFGFGDESKKGFGAARKDSHLSSQSTIRNGNGRFGNVEEGRNKRDVWSISTQPYADAHYAVFPPKLVEPCILAGSRVGDTVLDPFAGSGTTGLVATMLQRKVVLIEIKPVHCEQIHKRTDVVQQVWVS